MVRIYLFYNSTRLTFYFEKNFSSKAHLARPSTKRLRHSTGPLTLASPTAQTKVTALTRSKKRFYKLRRHMSRCLVLVNFLKANAKAVLLFP